MPNVFRLARIFVVMCEQRSRVVDADTGGIHPSDDGTGELLMGAQASRLSPVIVTKPGTERSKGTTRRVKEERVRRPRIRTTAKIANMF